MTLTFVDSVFYTPSDKTLATLDSLGHHNELHVSSVPLQPCSFGFISTLDFASF